MFLSKFGKPLWGEEWAGAGGWNSLKSISETESRHQLLKKKICSQTWYMPHLRHELPGNPIRLLVWAV